MISRPIILNQAYLESYEDYVENAFDFATSGASDILVENEATWYLAAEDPDHIEDDFMEQVQSGIDVCTHSLPFTSKELLNAGYISPQDEGAYIGMLDSAILCTQPKDYNEYYNETMKSEDYNCPVENLPFDYSDWNSKWYSPVCRKWFKDQHENYDRGTLSDLYLFAHASKVGIT